MLFSFVLGIVIHDEFETNLGTKIQTRENRGTALCKLFLGNTSIELYKVSSRSQTILLLFLSNRVNILPRELTNHPLNILQHNLKRDHREDDQCTCKTVFVFFFVFLFFVIVVVVICPKIIGTNDKLVKNQCQYFRKK